MTKLLALLITSFSIFLNLSQAEAGSTSRTFDGGNSWHHSDGSTSRTFDGGNSWHHSDGSTSRTFDGGNTWHHSR